MHNFEDNKCWKPIVKKFHASVSIGGDMVDILDIHDHTVASFKLSIKFGKVALEEQLGHSLIVIPVDGDAESFSPFSYDPEENTISTTIIKTNGEAQVFTATLDDLMTLNHNASFDHHHKPYKPMEDELDPGFSYPQKPQKPQDHPHDCKPPHQDWMHFEPDCGLNHKPLHDPYVTRSELMEESKKRQFNDIEIRKMLGENKKNEQSVFGRLESLESGLKFEVERSKNEDKLQKESFRNFEHSFDETTHFLKGNDEELKKAIIKESHHREEACSELFRLSNLAQADDTRLREKLEKLGTDHRRDVQILRSQDRDLHNEIIAEQSERVENVKEVRNLLRIEETNRHNAVKEALAKIDIEYHRASIKEEEIKQDCENNYKSLTKFIEILKSQITNAENKNDEKYQPKGEYVNLDDKGIILESTDAYMIESNTNPEPVLIAKIGTTDAVEFGDPKVALEFLGSEEYPTYNDKELAFVDNIPTDYVNQEQLNEALEQVHSLQMQLQSQIEKYNKLEDKYKTLNDQVYNLAIKVKELTTKE